MNSILNIVKDIGDNSLCKSNKPDMGKIPSSPLQKLIKNSNHNFHQGSSNCPLFNEITNAGEGVI